MEGDITWVDREPTPDPEEALKESVAQLTTKVDTLLKQQAQLIEMVGKLQDKKTEAEGSKAGKKKKSAKAKETQE